MKNKIAIFLIGIALGTTATLWLAKLYWGVQYGRKLQLAIRLAHETALAKEGQQTFETYMSSSPEIAIYAFTNHLRSLDEARSIFAKDPSSTNITVSLCLVDVCRAQMLCHARLAILFEKAGNVVQARQHLEAVLKTAADYRQFGGDFCMVTNYESVQQWVADCDRKKRFW